MVIRDMMRRDVVERVRSLELAVGSRQLAVTANCPLQTANFGRRITTHAVVLLVIAALAGCGVDTATTAATGASIKKQEVEEGKRTQERTQQKIDQMQEQMQQRAQQAADK